MSCTRCGATVAVSGGGVCAACGASLAGSPPRSAASAADSPAATDPFGDTPTIGVTGGSGDSDQATRLGGPLAGGDAGQETMLGGSIEDGAAADTGAQRAILAGQVMGFETALPGGDHETMLAGPDTLARISAIKKSSSDDGPLAIGQAFGSRYHIIRLLGIGGMGAVYQAWDAELAVAVAIKVIRPEVMADPTAAAEIEKRFKRELLLARQVTHKNVVRIHDLGEISGIKYITMPYVDGADLSTVLRTEGRLPPERVLRIARSIVAGLVEAHKRDVVHRDLKPANIMIDAADEAMIMDFGIARSTGAPVAGPMPGNTTIVGDLRRAAATPDATVLGAVIGTVEYMAPEQAKGQPVDQRADVYALGLIIYDMLTGRPRAQHMGSAVAELQGRMAQAPPAAKSFAPTTPAPLDALVNKCLEPDPAKRFQTSQELAEALARLDDHGNAVRVKRVVGMRLFAVVLTVVVAGLGTTWWFTRGPAPEVKHEPVSVLIADFQNTSGDPTFDSTLEPIMKLALEGAGFISAYDRVGIRRSLGVQPPDKLDDRTAQEIAVKQGVSVLLAGTVERQGSGYAVSVKAMQAVTGNEITSLTKRAASKDQVLAAATRLAEDVRAALGDNTRSKDDASRFAMDTLSATSLEAVRDYGAGMVATSRGRHDEAREKFLSAVTRDPKFGMGWTALGVAEYNLDRLQDAQEHIKQAQNNLGSMTERERYRMRGFYYALTNDYPQCAKEYGELAKRYAADTAARNNLALCLSHSGRMQEAVAAMKELVALLPKRSLYRVNLALYESYAGDFQTSEQAAREIEEPGVFGVLALAFAQLGQGQLAQAVETYNKVGAIDAQGASYAAAGLGDLAIYEGRFADAVKILKASAEKDLAEKEPDRAATKFAALAYAHFLRQQKAQAVDAVDRALANSSSVKIRFLAARVLVDVGELGKARKLAASLASELQTEPQSYAKIVEGAIALKNKDPRAAIKVLVEANTLLDTWISRFDLGRAYFEAEAYIQADSEFDRCITRRGEALSLFVDEWPTYGFLPTAYYYQGRVREALKTAGFAESYQTYLNIRGKSTEDALLPDVRKRSQPAGTR